MQGQCVLQKPLSCCEEDVAAAGTFAEEPIFTSTNEGGRFLDVRFERSLQLWPWSGFLALYIRVTQEGAEFQVQHPAHGAPSLLAFPCMSIPWWASIHRSKQTSWTCGR